LTILTNNFRDYAQFLRANAGKSIQICHGRLFSYRYLPSIHDDLPYSYPVTEMALVCYIRISKQLNILTLFVWNPVQ